MTLLNFLHFPYEGNPSDTDINMVKHEKNNDVSHRKKTQTTSQKKILRKIPSLPIPLHIKIRNRQINANTLLLILETG